MDPLALAAVVGLVYAGKRMSDTQDMTTDSTPRIAILDQIPQGSRQTYHLNSNDMGIQGSVINDPFPGVPARKREVAGTFADMSEIANRNPYGQPVYNLYNRQAVTNKMNNFPPIERKNIGPGIGVGPNVAATGGFQQFFRVLPNNINEERLTTLPGAEGPRNPVVKNGGTTMGDVTHQAKSTKAFHRPPAQNSGQGQGGALRGFEGRPDQIKTRRTTIRQETGPRGDSLEYGPAQYSVYQPYTGGLHDKSLPHVSNNRSNADRAGNAGRMNVREDPVNAVGAMTNIRSESVPFPVQTGGAGGGSSLNSRYVKPNYDKFNEFKGNKNPWSDTLDIAIKQLEKNSFIQEPLSAQ